MKKIIVFLILAMSQFAVAATSASLTDGLIGEGTATTYGEKFDRIYSRPNQLLVEIQGDAAKVLFDFMEVEPQKYENEVAPGYINKWRAKETKNAYCEEFRSLNKDLALSYGCTLFILKK